MSIEGLEAFVPRLQGDRVLLREWVPPDLEAFAALNADPRVMEHFPSPLTRSESDALVRERIVPQFAKLGFGLWAVEVPKVAPFIGYVGLQVHTFEAEFTPCVEIGWRMAFPYWGNGYATEAARLQSTSASRSRVWTRSCRSPSPRMAARSPSWSASG